jgi:hypothetical protein
VNRRLFGALLPLLFVAAACEGVIPGGTRDEVAEEAQPPVDPAVPGEPVAALSAEALGSLQAAEVVRATPWTSGRLDRGEGATGGRVADPAAPAEPDPDAGPRIAELHDVRVEAGEGYDRVIFAFPEEPRLPPFHLSFVEAPIIECGSGREVRPGGEGWLFVQFLDSRAHDETGESTIVRDVRAPGLPNLKEVRLTCDFEAAVEWVLGVADPGSYRVLEARDPTRLVVDVRH